MTFRARLAYGAAAAVAVAIVLASVLVYFLVRSELRSQLDATLRAQATQIPHLPGELAFHPRIGPHEYAIFVPADPFSGQFQYVDSTGNIYLPEEFNKTNPPLPGVAEARLVAARVKPDGFFDTNSHGTRLRIFTTNLSPPTADQPGLALEVASKLTDVDNELSTIRLWLVIVAAGGIAVAAGFGFLVARATLRPLRDLSETAERVRATRDLSERIAVGGTDELGTLASTFNAMLESLGEAAQRQQQLVQDASHELRTPLTSMRTNIEVLASADALPPGERAQLIRDVIDQLGEMTALVGELTELARGEEQASQFEEVRLDHVAEEAIRRAARNHPEVPIEAELEPTSVVGAPASLERAITNLLDNAAKWSPSGSAVEVRLSHGVLTVRDHGPGIAEEDIPHVFERFYRATSARSMPGSGLGLAIVQQIAEAHRGTISAELADGGGTLMRLSLPVRNNSPDSDEQSARDTPKHSLHERGPGLSRRRRSTI
ncbi:MAG TPA: HAMP domain-containing sensor histidine kinase [Gaiellaceae bacterium]|nr:HAMP domain-containing sensor histidine kinase [Gaiellaceae bacterium]